MHIVNTATQISLKNNRDDGLTQLYQHDTHVHFEAEFHSS